MIFLKIKEKKGELLIAKDLAFGPHVLTIISKNSRLGFEGVKILGENTSYFPEGSIKIMPNSGAITRQTNYLNISLNTAQMPPGYYLITLYLIQTAVKQLLKYLRKWFLTA